jgi:hypothetical protein
MIHKLGGLPSFELIPKREHVFQTGQPYSKIGWTRALNAINVLLISAKTRLAFVHILLTWLSQESISSQGWIQHDLVGGGGRCSASSGAELCRSCVPPAHQLASLHYCKILLDYCIWIVIVVHSSLIIMLLLKLLYLILPITTPPLARARGVHTPPHPPVNPSLVSSNQMPRCLWTLTLDITTSSGISSSFSSSVRCVIPQLID